MRFCLVTTFFPPQHFGGDAIVVAGLANLLVSQGHHVEVIHCTDSFRLLQGNIPESQFPIDPRVIVHPIASPLGALSPLLTHLTGRPFGKKSQLEQILAQGFDVTHWHNLSLIGGPAALAMGRGVRLMTLHEYWLTCPTSILFRDNEAVCTDRHCIRCTLNHHRPPQLWRYGSLVQDQIKNVDLFLAPSQFVADKYQEHLGIRAEVLPNFLASTTSLEKKDDGYYLVVGRLEKYKGIQDILPFFKNSTRRLKIAGDGSFAPELKTLASNDPNIEFLGRLPHHQLAQLYAGARATLVPSICWETFGLTVLESLNQGTPVITSNYGALPEIILATGGGWVYNNFKELSQILQLLDSNPSTALTKGLAGSQRLSTFSPENHLESYLRLIAKVKRSAV